MSEQLMASEQAGLVEHTQETPRSGRKLVKIGGIIVGALLATSTVAACSSRSDSAKAADIQVVTYHDRDLVCRVEEESYSTYAYDCDFDGYYADPSYDAPSSISRIAPGTFSEITVPYDGGSLTCLVYDQDHDTYAETCDYAGFHNNQH